ncbi:MAG: hypothetical protein ACI4PL_05350 [Faecousia sp.]
MKRKTLYVLLGCEAVLIGILVLLTDRFPALFSSLPAFPFEQLALGIAAIARVGNIGNGLAVALWAGISLLPAILALRKHPGMGLGERISLFFLSAVLFAALYGMANPGAFCPGTVGSGTEFYPIIRAVLGVSVWSAIFLAVIVGLVKRFAVGDTLQLLTDLKRLLYALCLYVAAVLVCTPFRELIASIKGSPAPLDTVFSLLRFLAASVPYAMDLLLSIYAIALLDPVIGANPSGIVEASRNLSRVSCTALVASAASPAVVNAAQLLFLPHLSQACAAVELPLVSIVFTLILLLLSRLLVENKRLREDNDLFI